MNSTLMTILKYLAYGLVVTGSQLGQAYHIIDPTIAGVLIGMVVSLLGIHVYGAVSTPVNAASLDANTRSLQQNTLATNQNTLMVSNPTTSKGVPS